MPMNEDPRDDKTSYCTHILILSPEAGRYLGVTHLKSTTLIPGGTTTGSLSRTATPAMMASNCGAYIFLRRDYNVPRSTTDWRVTSKDGNRFLNDGARMPRLQPQLYIMIQNSQYNVKYATSSLAFPFHPHTMRAVFRRVEISYVELIRTWVFL